jgi:hypothetical protein
MLSLVSLLVKSPIGQPSKRTPPGGGDVEPSPCRRREIDILRQIQLTEPETKGGPHCGDFNHPGLASVFLNHRESLKMQSGDYRLHQESAAC